MRSLLAPAIVAVGAGLSFGLICIAITDMQYPSVGRMSVAVTALMFIGLLGLRERSARRDRSAPG